MSRTIIGESPVIKELLGMIHRVAATKTNVLILGESGTGKELVARMIHQSGPLRGQPFVPVNCGAIPETLIETELFGHHKGSFTGAVSDKLGLFEAANKGTLFLDEVGELPPLMQVKLLRAIQERVFRKVGGVNDIQVDVRIIAATNRDLEAATQKGTFREDLYYRLNVIQIKTPPLRERIQDISILAKTFLKTFSDRSKRVIEGFDPAVLEALELYPWPGNVRELENVIERAVTMEVGPIIQLQALPAGIQQLERKSLSSLGTGVQEVRNTVAGSEGKGSGLHLPPPNFHSENLNLDQILADVEKAYLSAALQHARGAKYRAAELLGINFRSLRYRMKKLKLESF